jgi:hypothetical protein
MTMLRKADGLTESELNDAFRLEAELAKVCLNINIWNRLF